MATTTRAIRRGHCRFDIITSTRAYKFKTPSDPILDEWITAINETIRSSGK
jgi:hypothetical protein